jgi:hypothetical protein
MTEIATTTPSPITMGFGSLQSFEFMQRTAKMFSESSMVPTAYRAANTKGYGNNMTTELNPSAMPNCMIALNMSQRMNADPLMIMQNLHVIEGRPSWSSQFIIAAINSCGRFSPLRFEIQQGPEIEATCTSFEWENGKKKANVTRTKVKNTSCIAWVLELATNTRLESPKVTMEMAVNEGWYGKNGSKWQTMPDLMLRYRSAAFFGRIYAPELLMGLPSAEESIDLARPMVQNQDGVYVPKDDTTGAQQAATMAQPMSKSEKKAAEKQHAEDAEVKEQATSPNGEVNQETGEVKEEKKPVTQAEKTVTKPAKTDLAGDEILISAPQVKYLQNKIQSIDLPESAVQAMLTRVGAQSLETLTVEQFDAVKSELLSQG